MASNNTTFVEDDFIISGELVNFSIYHIYGTIFVPLKLVLGIVGFVCSVVCVSAFNRFESANSTTRFLLQMVSVNDVVYLVLTIIDCITNLIQNQMISHSIYITARMLYNTSSIVAVWLILMATFDRYAIACRPDLAAKYSTPTRVKVAVGFVWIASLVTNLPLCFEYTVEHDVETDTTYSELTALILSRVYFIAYRIVFQLLLCLTLPLFPTAFLLHRLVRHIRRTGKSSDRRRPAQRDVIADVTTPAVDHERQLTTTVTVVVVFFVALDAVVLVLEAVLWSFGYAFWFHDVEIISHTAYFFVDVTCFDLKVVIASLKILIYAKTNIDFREALRRVIPSCLRRRRRDDESVFGGGGGLSPYNVCFDGDTVEFSPDLPLVVRQ